MTKHCRNCTYHMSGNPPVCNALHTPTYDAIDCVDWEASEVFKTHSYWREAFELVNPFENLPETLVALFTTAPTDYATGSGGTEVTGGSYARASVVNNSDNHRRIELIAIATPNGLRWQYQGAVITGYLCNVPQKSP